MLAAALLDDLPDGSSALVLAIEHLWAVPLRDAVRDAGGVVVAHRSMTAEDLIAFGMAIGAEADEPSDAGLVRDAGSRLSPPCTFIPSG